jgi:hypothetical protein
LEDLPAFDSIGLGEGEELICALAENLDQLDRVPGLCYRQGDGSVVRSATNGNPGDLDALPFPKRTEFHDYFDKPIASVLSSRGCWRNCSFCSINAWYERVGGKKFRTRSIPSIVEEMRQLYFDHGVRIFNFQDDNFFLPNPTQALARFKDLRAGLLNEGVEGIAIAVKARPDSINRDSIGVLDDLGIFRVFLGVENASESALRHYNRKCTVEQILESLRILNDFDIHVAFNLLMFEPDTVMDDILVNLRFIERHMDNPFNFCRAEVHVGTGLEAKLLAEDRLLGDYFGLDYRLKDPRCEAFHQIANYAFFDRNFSDAGLHYFNMQVDFYFQLLRRLHPEVLTLALRGAARNFIKQTNLDTYGNLCRIYDFVAAVDPADQRSIGDFAGEMRATVDAKSRSLRAQGEYILQWLTDSYEGNVPTKRPGQIPTFHEDRELSPAGGPMPYQGLQKWHHGMSRGPRTGRGTGMDALGIITTPIPYDEFKKRLSKERGGRR